MTALGGVWSWSSAVSPPESCAKILQAQHVYAPDPPASWSGEGITLGRRLARLLPEDRHDTGPMVSPDGKHVIVADVRLDNRADLLNALGIAAREGERMADAALVAAAIHKWREEAVHHLFGDFAFAWWDLERQRLLLARDFLGQRPLHFHAGPGFFAFASMPKGLHALEAVPREPDEDAVARFLLLIPEVGSGTFFRNVERVPPGHCTIVTRSGVEHRPYWEPRRTLIQLPDPADYQEAVRESLDRAVAARLRGADNRVATHLSGGLDSSIVASTAARLLGPGSTIAAFTAVPAEGYHGHSPRGRFIDEGPLAAATAALYPQMEHVLVRTGSQPPLDALDRNFFLFDRPILNLCNGTWIDAIAAEAKQRRIKVLLTGTHGNMSVSYTGIEILPELLRRGRLVPLMRQLQRLRRHGVSLESGLAHTIGPFLPAAAWRAINRVRGRSFELADFSAVRRERIEHFQRTADELDVDFSYRPRQDPFATRLWVLRRQDHGNFNKGYLGGWGVDVRDPTADQRLIELCLSIPPEQFLASGQPRALARKAFADRLPAAVVNEYRKGLQAIDWHVGMDASRATAKSEVERLEQVGPAARVLNLPMLKALVNNWPDGDWNSDKVMKRYRLALLRGLSAGHFIRKAAGSNV